MALLLSLSSSLLSECFLGCTLTPCALEPWSRCSKGAEVKKARRDEIHQGRNEGSRQVYLETGSLGVQILDGFKLQLSGLGVRTFQGSCLSRASRFSRTLGPIWANVDGVIACYMHRLGPVTKAARTHSLSWKERSQ